MQKLEYPEFNFQWQWIRDKVIEVNGDRWAGVLTIWDEEGHQVAIWAYQLITNEE